MRAAASASQGIQVALQQDDGGEPVDGAGALLDADVFDSKPAEVLASPPISLAQREKKIA